MEREKESMLILRMSLAESATGLAKQPFRATCYSHIVHLPFAFYSHILCAVNRIRLFIDLASLGIGIESYNRKVSERRIGKTEGKQTPNRMSFSASASGRSTLTFRRNY
jgi:hypothetical protein